MFIKYNYKMSRGVCLLSIQYLTPKALRTTVIVEVGISTDDIKTGTESIKVQVLVTGPGQLYQLSAVQH